MNMKITVKGLIISSVFIALVFGLLTLLLGTTNLNDFFANAQNNTHDSSQPPSLSDVYEMFKRGDFETGLISLNMILDNNPNDVPAIYYKGIALGELGKNEEAIQQYDKVIAIDPNYLNALNNKAFALSELGKNEEALSIISPVVEINPNNEDYLSTIAFILYNLGRYEEAKSYYSDAIAVNPDLIESLSNKEVIAYNELIGPANLTSVNVLRD